MIGLRNQPLVTLSTAQSRSGALAPFLFLGKYFLCTYNVLSSASGNTLDNVTSFSFPYGTYNFMREIASKQRDM
jgi:hypothetical protein